MIEYKFNPNKFRKKFQQVYYKMSFRLKMSYLTYKLYSSITIKEWVYCKRGRHRVKPVQYSYSNSETKVEYKCDAICCRICDTLWFPTKEDKKNFLHIKERDIDLFEDILDRMKKNKK